MSLTQHQKVLRLLRDHPEGITTNQLLASEFGLASEYRARISELRKQGYGITCDIKRGGSSVWTLVREPPKVEANGQMAFA